MDAFLRSSKSPEAERTTVRMMADRGVLFRKARIENPSPRGIFKSVISIDGYWYCVRSSNGFSPLRYAIASSPQVTSRSSADTPLASIARLMRNRSSGSSSTTRIVSLGRFIMMGIGRVDKSAKPDNVFYAAPFGILRNQGQSLNRDKLRQSPDLTSTKNWLNRAR